MNEKQSFDNYWNSMRTPSLIFILAIFLILACVGSTPSPTILAPQDLSNEDFTYMDLRGSNLANKNLQNAIFVGAALDFVDVSSSNLQGANLMGATVNGTNFSYSDLRGANLDGVCFLEEAIWTGSLLDGRWRDIIDLVTTGIQPGQDLTSYRLNNLCLLGVDLSYTNLQNVDLTESTLSSSNLEGANLSQANLMNTKLIKANLTNANLTSANLTGTDLSYARLTGATVTQEQLQSAYLDCTRMPDGSLFEEERCIGTPPAP